MAPEEEKSLGVILFRVGAVEASIRDMREEMKGGFAGLQFVGREVYLSEKTAAKDYAEETRAIATGARAVAMWALGVTVMLGLGGLIGLIRLAVS